VTESVRPLPPPPPHSPEAERAILGGLLVHDETIDLISDSLLVEDFYSDAHRLIYEGIREMAGRGGGIDPMALSEHLKSKGKLEKAGGLQYLNEIQSETPTAANIEIHAQLVARLARRREALKASMEIYSRLRGPIEDEEGDLDWAEQRMFHACKDRHIGRRIKLAKVAAKEAWDDLQRLKAIEGLVTGVPTGHGQLDAMTNGYQPGDLVILAARPSMGKTAYAMQTAWNAVQRAEGAVVFFSLETKAVGLMKRLLSHVGQVDNSLIRLPARMTDKEWGEVYGAVEAIEKSRLWIDDSPFLSAFDIRARARRLKAAQGLSLVLIDYLQIMKGIKEANEDNRERMVAGITRDLKSMAKDLDVPVICLSQLNRGPENRNNKRPMMADLRDSGAIEQDADLIMFLYRGARYYPRNPEVATNGAELIVGKNREGPVGALDLIWDENHYAFNDWEDELAVYPHGSSKKTSNGRSRPSIAQPREEGSNEQMPF